MSAEAGSRECGGVPTDAEWAATKCTVARYWTRVNSGVLITELTTRLFHPVLTTVASSDPGMFVGMDLRGVASAAPLSWNACRTKVALASYVVSAYYYSSKLNNPPILDDIYRDLVLDVVVRRLFCSGFRVSSDGGHDYIKTLQAILDVIDVFCTVFGCFDEEATRCTRFKRAMQLICAERVVRTAFVSHLLSETSAVVRGAEIDTDADIAKLRRNMALGAILTTNWVSTSVTRRDIQDIIGLVKDPWLLAVNGNGFLNSFVDDLRGVTNHKVHVFLTHPEHACESGDDILTRYRNDYEEFLSSEQLLFYALLPRRVCDDLLHMIDSRLLDVRCSEQLQAGVAGFFRSLVVPTEFNDLAAMSEHWYFLRQSTNLPAIVALCEAAVRRHIGEIVKARDRTCVRDATYIESLDAGIHRCVVVETCIRDHFSFADVLRERPPFSDTIADMVTKLILEDDADTCTGTSTGVGADGGEAPEPERAPKEHKGRRPQTICTVLAYYAHDALRGRMDGVRLTEDAAKAALDRVIRTLVYIRDRDVFIDTFRSLLTTRLLSGRPDERGTVTDTDVEFVTTLGVKYGEALVSTMLRQLKDYASSDAVRDATWFEDSPLTPTVLCFSAWPSFQAREVPLTLPRDMTLLWNDYVAKYTAVYSGRRLRLLLSMGSVYLTTGPVTCRLRLCVSPSVAALLLLFNETEDDTVSVDDAAYDLGTSIETVAALASGPVQAHVLTRSLDSSGGGVFAVNSGFKRSRTRTLVLPHPRLLLHETDVGAGAAAGGAGAVDKRLAMNRKLLIEAAIVRLVKTRGRIDVADIVTETTSQFESQFPVHADVVSGVLASLVDREYIEYTSPSRETVKYIA